MSARLALSIALSLAGTQLARDCRESRHHPPSAHRETPTPEQAPTPEPPRAAMPAPMLRQITRAAPSNEAAALDPPAGDVPDHGCALGGPRRAALGIAGAPAAIGLETGHAIITYTIGGVGVEAVLVVTEHDGGTPRIVTRFAVSPSIAATQLVPPAIARIDANHVAVATTDGLRRIDYREIDRTTGTSTEPIRIAEGTVDVRFPSSIAVIGSRRLVAYTKVGDPQRVEVVVLDATPRVLARHDVTPDSSGAASPNFVRDATPPYLVFVDPREAFSLSHAVTFDANGAPGEDDALQPILGLVTPARIVAAITPHDLELAFLAHGETNHMGAFVLASRANAITPRPLVPATDFARLWVDALGASFGAITASLAPHGGAANAPREAVVRLIDSAGIGPELRIAATRGSAVYPMISRDDEGHLALVFGTEYGVDLLPIVCRGSSD